MVLRDYIQKFLNRYNALNLRQKLLVNILVIVILINLFYTNVYSKQARVRKLLKVDLVSIDNRLRELRLQFPDLDKERKEISEQQRQLDALHDKLKKLEEAFPTQSRIPQLLAKLIESAQGRVDFVSIVPKSSQDQGVYSHLDIEITVNCSYADLANYIFRLERLPEFVVISDVSLDKKTDELVEYVEAKIMFSTLLTEEETDEPKEIIAYTETTQPLIAKDPFLAKEDKVSEIDIMAPFKLTGIIFRGEKSVAIINNDVYKIGDNIGDKTVTKIFKDKVILKDNSKTYRLDLEK